MRKNHALCNAESEQVKIRHGSTRSWGQKISARDQKFLSTDEQDPVIFVGILYKVIN